MPFDRRTDDPWAALAAACREAKRAAETKAGDDAPRPPFGFQGRVVARWRDERTRRSGGMAFFLWERLALRGAVCAAVLLGAALVIPAPNPGPSASGFGLLPDPGIGIPVPVPTAGR